MSEEQELTRDCVSILLVDQLALEINQADEMVDRVLAELRRISQDLVATLDPPTGMRVWLEAHGLSLVATHDAPPVRAWDRMAMEEEPVEAPDTWVGAAVRYRTAPSGPRQEISVGSGVVTAMLQTQRGVVVTVKVPGRGLVHLCPADGDQIEASGQGRGVPGT